jgi:hypothetical protein
MQQSSLGFLINTHSPLYIDCTDTNVCGDLKCDLFYGSFIQKLQKKQAASGMGLSLLPSTCAFIQNHGFVFFNPAQQDPQERQKCFKILPLYDRISLNKQVLRFFIFL